MQMSRQDGMALARFPGQRQVPYAIIPGQDGQHGHQTLASLFAIHRRVLSVKLLSPICEAFMLIVCQEQGYTEPESMSI